MIVKVSYYIVNVYQKKYRFNYKITALCLIMLFHMLTGKRLEVEEYTVMVRI